jgi:hypothetical protein
VRSKRSRISWAFSPLLAPEQVIPQPDQFRILASGEKFADRGRLPCQSNPGARAGRVFDQVEAGHPGLVGLKQPG